MPAYTGKMHACMQHNERLSAHDRMNMETWAQEKEKKAEEEEEDEEEEEEEVRVRTTQGGHVKSHIWKWKAVEVSTVVLNLKIQSVLAVFRRLVTQSHVNNGLKALHCSLLAEEFPTGFLRFTPLTVTQNLHQLLVCSKLRIN